MREFLTKQFSDKFLWVPIILAFAAACYFTMPTEPNISHPIIAFISCAIILLFGKMNFWIRGAVLFMFGFLYAAVYTQVFVQTPVLKHDLREIDIVATVTDIDIAENKRRLVLRANGNELNTKHPTNIKLTITDDKPTPDVGDVLRAKVSLFPPAHTEVPETFNYARWAYFNGLTATGFIIDYIGSGRRYSRKKSKSKQKRAHQRNRN